MKRVDSKLSKIVLLALMLSLSVAADSITTAKKPTVQANTISNSYIVTCGSTSLPTALKSKVSSLKGQITSNLDGTGIAIITSDDPNFATEIAKVTGVTSVVNDRAKQWIKPNWSTKIVRLDDFPIPYSISNQNFLYNLQWGLDAINAPEAWKTGARGCGALVAVLDTGFDLTHPDLKDNINFQKSRNFVPFEGLQWNGPEDGISHGTHVASIIAGVDNDVGVIGVAPEAKLMLVKVLRDADGYGEDAWVLAGMKYAIDQGADIINLSLGDEFDINHPSVTAFNQMMAYAQKKGVTVIAAAGNSANDMDELRRKGRIDLPAESNNVIAVSATAPIGWATYPLITNLDNIANYSNIGSSITLAAPGGDDIYGGPEDELSIVGGFKFPTYYFDLVMGAVNGGWTWLAGTSMAAPHVAGVAALIVGKTGRISPDQLKKILIASADDLGDPGQDIYYGYGRVNAYKAVLSCGYQSSFWY